MASDSAFETRGRSPNRGPTPVLLFVSSRIRSSATASSGRARRCPAGSRPPLRRPWRTESSPRCPSPPRRSGWCGGDRRVDHRVERLRESEPQVVLDNTGDAALAGDDVQDPGDDVGDLLELGGGELDGERGLRLRRGGVEARIMSPVAASVLEVSRT
jgi:hypothetical protein